MRRVVLLAVCGVCVIMPFVAFGETQIRNDQGVVIEMRVPFRNMSYAFDGNRHPLYVATSIPGNLDVVEYRDNRGVYTGVGGVGTIQWAQEPPLQFGASGRLSDR